MGNIKDKIHWETVLPVREEEREKLSDSLYVMRPAASGWKQTQGILTPRPFLDRSECQTKTHFLKIDFADSYLTDKTGSYQIIQSGCD